MPPLLVAAIYWPLFPDMAAVWDYDPNYSHGYLVPVLSLLFAWMAWREAGRQHAQTVEQKHVMHGMALIGFGLILHITMWFVHNLFLDVLSLITVLQGLVLMWGGTAASRTYNFPIRFLIFMAPLPLHWYQPFAVRMQQLVSHVSTFLLSACGVPVYQEGYFIYLPGYTMAVAEACSGLRQLLAILALGVVIGHFSGRGPRYRWTLGLLAIPIAVFANCIRVVCSGFILMAFGEQWAEGFFHTVEGLVIIALSAGLLVATAWGLARLDDRAGAGQAATPDSTDTKTEAPKPNDAAARSAGA